MKYKPDEKDWMAYLYGELEDDQRRAIDQYILENPEGQSELEQFRNLRDLMSSLEDKEIIAPPIVITEYAERPGKARRYFWNSSSFRTISTVAASLVIIILAGKLTGAHLTVTNSEVRLGFGSAPAPATELADLVTKDQVREMIDASLESNNSRIEASLEESQKKLSASIRGNLAMNSGKIDQLVRQASTASQEQIRQFAETIRAENMQQVKDYFQLTSAEQKTYIENLLVDFAKYLQQQRNDDLQLVQTRMKSLEENTVLLKQETEQILSSIITTVGTPVSAETRN